MQQFEQVNFGDYPTTKMQFNTAKFANEFSKIPLFGGRLITGLDYSSTLTKDIEHGLGRLPIGFLVTMRSSNANLYKNTTDQKYFNDKTIRLVASANGIFDIWIF